MNHLPRNISSLEVAEMVGRDHKEVLRDIRNIKGHLAESKIALSDYFAESTYKDSTGRTLPCFLLTKKGCELYGTRMTGEKGTQFAVKYINRFNEMEQHIQQTLPQDPITLALKAALETREQVQSIQQDIDLLKDGMRIDGRQEYALKEQGKAKVLQELGGYGSLAYEKLSRKVFAQLWRDFKKHFVLPRSMELPRARFDEGVKFIAMWRPDTSLAIDIEAANKQAQFKLVE